MASKDDLISYYKISTLLAHKKEFTLTEIEDMIPFELDIRLDLIKDILEESTKQK